jgi:hypothetical protein
VNQSFIVFDIARRQKIGYRVFADKLYNYLISSDEDEMPEDAREEYDEELRKAKNNGKPIWRWTGDEAGRWHSSLLRECPAFKDWVDKRCREAFSPLTGAPMEGQTVHHDHSHQTCRSQGPLPGPENTSSGSIAKLAQEVTDLQYTGTDPAVFFPLWCHNLRQIIDRIAQLLEEPTRAYPDLFQAVRNNNPLATLVRDHLTGETSASMEKLADAMRAGVFRGPSDGTFSSYIPQPALIPKHQRWEPCSRSSRCTAKIGSFATIPPKDAKTRIGAGSALITSGE